MNIKNKKIPAPDAIILHANYAVFPAGGTVHFDNVQSRMFLWCKSGKGVVTVNDKPFSFSAGSFLFTPWNHKIHYVADKKNPFLLAGIHIIPKLEDRGNPVYSIYHNAESSQPEYSKRHNVDIPELPTVFSGTLFLAPALEKLAEYIVAWFEQYNRHNREEFMARNLAVTLLYELIKTKEKQLGFSGSIPHGLKQILSFIENNVENDIKMPELARQINGSRSTVFRLFKKHLNCTPGSWIHRRKMERACELLKRTDLRIGEIGERISIGDPYYFSKLFKKFIGLTAKEYRKEYLFIGKTPVIKNTN